MSLSFHGFQLNPDTRELTFHGNSVGLEPKVFEALLYLIQHRDHVVSKDELQDNVWKAVVSDASVAKCVAKIRKALNDNSSSPEIIQTIPRKGYRFIASVEQPTIKQSNKHENSSLKTVAILPFLNLGNDPENEYFCDGVVYEISHLLNRIPQLKVCSLTSTFALKSSAIDLKTISNTLNADLILEGSIRRAEDYVRISIQLVDAINDIQLWSESFSGVIGDMFEIQDNIANEIAHRLSANSTQNSLKSYRSNPIAFDYYLRAVSYLNKGDSIAVNNAIKLFDKSINEDQNYYRAWAGKCRALLDKFQWIESKAIYLEEANSCSLKALELAPNAVESHTARGFVLANMDNFSKASDEFNKALAIDPQNYDASYLFARTQFAEGYFSEAARLFEIASQSQPDEFLATCLRVFALQRLEFTEEYREQASRAMSRVTNRLLLNPDDTRALTLGAVVCVHAGQKDLGFEYIQKALAITPEDGAVLHNCGCAYAIAGETDKALDIFEKCFKKGTVYKKWIDQDPDFDSLRDHPRFKQLLAKYVVNDD